MGRQHPKCSTEYCANESTVKGLCNRCYQHLWRHGRIPTHAELEEAKAKRAAKLEASLGPIRAENAIQIAQDAYKAASSVSARIYWRARLNELQGKPEHTLGAISSQRGAT